MFPTMFNVQRPSPSGLLSTNLGGAQSAFHVPGSTSTSTPNSPPMAAMAAVDPASPFMPTSVAQQAALLTLQAAAVAHAQAVAAVSSNTAAGPPPVSPFPVPASPSAALGGGLLIGMTATSPRGGGGAERKSSSSQHRAASAAGTPQQNHNHHHRIPTTPQHSPAASVSGADRPMKTASAESASSAASTQHPAEPQSPGVCSICSDRATGKHYGANSCDGCKGFFRRTVRKRQNYVCRFSRTCVIDRDKRNTCRYCRFKKCLDAGMRREAVQNERDRISSKRSRQQMSTEEPEDVDEPEPRAKISTASSIGGAASPTAASTSGSGASASASASAAKSALISNSTLCNLMHAEKATSQLRDSVITAAAATNNNPIGAAAGANAGPSSTTPGDNPSASGATTKPSRLATITDLSDAIQQQLLLLVEWAKLLPPFFDLPLNDQIAMLRAYSAQHLLLGVARRSLPYKDVLLLSNDACIPRSHSSELHDVNHVVVRLLDELVEPMREIQLDDTEYACVKALLFFNPSAFGLQHKNEVKATRRRFLEALQAYVNEKQIAEDKVRFGNILLLLPPLQAMSQQFIEDLQLATLFGMARFDKLLEELLLAAAEPLSAPFLVDGMSSAANKLPGGLVDLVNGNGDPNSTITTTTADIKRSISSSP